MCTRATKHKTLFGHERGPKRNGSCGAGMGMVTLGSSQDLKRDGLQGNGQNANFKVISNTSGGGPSYTGTDLNLLASYPDKVIT